MRRRRRNPMSPLDAMTWSSDDLVRDIASEIDDRDLYDIAEGVMGVFFGHDWDEDDESIREFDEPKATKHLTLDEARDAQELASRIVDWANYGLAYGDLGDPPWEDDAEYNWEEPTVVEEPMSMRELVKSGKK